jgi:hypothetical protein
VAYNNPAGVIVQDIGAGVGVENQTTNVTIPSSARIIDNATIGLSIGAVLNLAIADGFTVARTLTSLQATGIQFTKQDVVTTAKRPAGIRIGRIGHAGYSGSIFDYPNGTADAPNDGGSIYEIDFTGSPESAYLAPIGSKFVDRTSGQHYIKSTAGTSNTGWVRVMRDNDPTIITPIVENTAGALELFAHVGSNVFVGTDDTTLYWGMGAGGEIRNFSITTYIETQTPTLTITQRTTDNPTHNWSFSGQVPFASATGTNRDGGGFDFLTAVPVSGGVKGSFRIRYNGTTYFEVQGDAIAWFNGTPVTKQTVTGSLSTVVDPAAKAVLTSIIAAFAGASGYNLITDGTM